MTELLQKYYKNKISYNINTIETVLINSNFNCGIFINRDKLFHLLKYKYKLHTLYDPCSYPGIQCKFYYNKKKKNNDGICECEKMCTKKNKCAKKNSCVEISFMVFRTGSILIVGNCTDNIIQYIYNFLKKIIIDEYTKIYAGINIQIKKKKKTKKKKIYLLIQK